MGNQFPEVYHFNDFCQDRSCHMAKLNHLRKNYFFCLQNLPYYLNPPFSFFFAS